MAANIALHLTAPNKATVALFFDVDPTSLIAAAATHEAAAVDGFARLVARATLCP